MTTPRIALLVSLACAGCALASTPSDDATFDAEDAAVVDSAWCSAFSCDGLATRCHATTTCVVPHEPCFDTRRNVCTTYTCTLPCVPDAGLPDGGACGASCQPCCPGEVCHSGFSCGPLGCRGGAPCDAGR